MFLYTTILYIKSRPVRYEVSAQEGNRLLIYKPELPYRNIAELPVFWVTFQNGEWTPVNIKDSALFIQVINDIKAHQKMLG